MNDVVNKHQNKPKDIFTVPKRENVFLTSELANEAEITILSAWDTTRAWVPAQGIMGRNVGYIRLGITRGCHLGFRTNRVLFVSFCLIFPFAVRNVGYQSGSVRPD